jgi:hypothetical protein
LDNLEAIDNGIVYSKCGKKKAVSQEFHTQQK